MPSRDKRVAPKKKPTTNTSGNDNVTYDTATAPTPSVTRSAQGPRPPPPPKNNHPTSSPSAGAAAEAPAAEAAAIAAARKTLAGGASTSTSKPPHAATTTSKKPAASTATAATTTNTNTTAPSKATKPAPSKSKASTKSPSKPAAASKKPAVSTSTPTSTSTAPRHLPSPPPRRPFPSTTSHPPRPTTTTTTTTTSSSSTHPLQSLELSDFCECCGKGVGWANPYQVQQSRKKLIKEALRVLPPPHSKAKYFVDDVLSQIPGKKRVTMQIGRVDLSFGGPPTPYDRLFLNIDMYDDRFISLLASGKVHARYREIFIRTMSVCFSDSHVGQFAGGIVVRRNRISDADMGDDGWTAVRGYSVSPSAFSRGGARITRLLPEDVDWAMHTDAETGEWLDSDGELDYE